MNIDDNTDIVKSPESCFKQNVIDGYGLSKVKQMSSVIMY